MDLSDWIPEEFGGFKISPPVRMRSATGSEGGNATVVCVGLFFGLSLFVLVCLGKAEPLISLQRRMSFFGTMLGCSWVCRGECYDEPHLPRLNGPIQLHRLWLAAPAEESSLLGNVCRGSGSRWS